MERLTELAKRLEERAALLAEIDQAQATRLDPIIERTRRLIEESRQLIEQANELLAVQDAER